MQGLTPTQLEARERHLKFKRSIAERAAQLEKSKLANETMVAAIKTEIAALEPESFPAETDPLAPKGTHWFGPTSLDGTFTLHNYPKVEDIQKEVCKYFGISRIDLCSPRRDPKVTVPRQIGYYLSRELTPRSLPDIARRFGRSDHSAIIHGIRKIVEHLPQNEDLAFDVAYLIHEITGDYQ